MGDWDEFSGDYSWLDDLTNAGFGADDLGPVLDTWTGQLVDPSTLSPQDLADLDLSGSGSGPVGESPFTGSLDTSPISRSTSDQLRSREGDMTPAEQIGYMDSIQPLDDGSGWGGWGKALAQGLGSALSGLGGAGKGLGGLAAPSAGGSLPSLGGMMSGPGPSGGGLPAAPGFDKASMTGLGGVDGGPRAAGFGGMSEAGLTGLLRPPDLDQMAGPRAEFLRGQADPGARLGLQAPIDPGREPARFTPLMLPAAGGAVPMAAAPPAPRMSGLQRLLLERLG